MFSRNLLGRYADTIQDSDKQNEFRRRAGMIEFDARGLCVGGAPRLAFQDSSVDDLRVDFEKRFTEFLRPEDFPNFKKESAE